MNFNVDYYLGSLVFVIEGSLKTACRAPTAGCCEFFVRFLFAGLAAKSDMFLVLPGHPIQPVKLFSAFGTFFHLLPSIIPSVSCRFYRPLSLSCLLRFIIRSFAAGPADKSAAHIHFSHVLNVFATLFARYSLQGPAGHVLFGDIYLYFC